VNPSFETGDFTGWTVGGNTVVHGVGRDGDFLGSNPPFHPAYINVRSGEFAAWAAVKNPIIPSNEIERLLLTQTLAVRQNTEVSVGFWLGNGTASTYGVQTAIDQLQIYVDGVAMLACCDSPNIHPGTTPADFHLFSQTFNTGSRSSITVTYAVNGSGGIRAPVPFDDFYFITEPVPEPFSWTLAVAGLVAGCLFQPRRIRNSQIG